MQISFSPSSSAYVAVSDFSDRIALKECGFKWNPDVRRWSTTSAAAANLLRMHADEATRARIDAQLAVAAQEKAAAAEKAAVALAASRATDADIEIPCAAGRSFLPYQKAGIAYAMDRPNILLGDDMGLGKTAQAIGILNMDETLKRVLIVCPASLTRNWVREIGFFQTRGLTVGIATSKKGVPDVDVVIVTYDAFSRMSPFTDALKEIGWDALILDEAHYLKHEDSRRTKEILGGKDTTGISARRKIFLTGTPVTNRPIELWPLVHALAPREFSRFLDFAKRYCGARQGSFGWDFSGASNLAELQDRLRATVMVRRLKSDVLAELPAKRRQVLELPADTPALRAALKLEETTEKAAEAEQARLKKAVAAASSDPEAFKKAVAALAAAKQVAFTELSKVRHATAVAKIPSVAAHVRDAVEAGSKVILFAHHVDVIDALADALADLGVVTFTGSTPVEKRQGIVDRFQSDEGVRIFIGNIAAAGVGITLTASAHVIFAELDWVPGNLSQAEDRAHRMGQRDSVLVQHLVLEGSIDAKMAVTVTEKQAVIDAAMDTEESLEARDARIAAAQAAQDAALAATELRVAKQVEEAEAARVAAEEARAAAEARKAEREATRETRVAAAQAWLADREARRTARLSDSLARAAADLAGTAAPGAEERLEILAALRFLAADDADGATIRNGVGFSKVDSYHGHELASRDTLDDGEARVGRELVRRYRGQLEGRNTVPTSTEIPAVAAPVEVVSAPVVVVPEPAIFVPTSTEINVPVAVKRGRGRPTKASQGKEVMSQVERTRRWRAARRSRTMEVPAAVAGRIHAMRATSGMTTEALLLAALDALAAQGGVVARG